jgi:hypothetical protein
MSRLPFLCLALTLPATGLLAQDTSHAGHNHMDHAAHHPAPAGDSGFAALQQRGGVYMGVDQSKAAHRFDALPDGGRIELLSVTGDSADVAAIRRHFRMIVDQFAAGDFETPFAVHAEPVPGTAVMQERRDKISYQRTDLPRGAALRLVTRDGEALKAIHEFMAYQRREHRAPGLE